MAEHVCFVCEETFDGALGRNCDECGEPICCECYEDGNLCPECEDSEEEDIATEVDTEDEDEDVAIDDDYDEEDEY